MRRKPFSLRKYFSTKWRSLYSHQSQRRSNFAPFFGRDGWLPTIFIDIVNQLLAVVTTVRKYTTSFYIYMLQYGYCVIDVISLPLAKRHIHRISVSVYCCVDFGTGSSPAVSDFIWRPPFFAPALCWWACTIDASSDNSSSSASRLSTRKILSRIPSSIHLRKRLYTEFQDP